MPVDPSHPSSPTPEDGGHCDQQALSSAEVTGASGTNPSNGRSISSRRSRHSSVQRSRPSKSKRARSSITPSDESAKPPSKDQASATDGVSKPSADDSSRYEVLDELGRGGWGVVERAIDRQLKRPVAIKKISGSRRPTESVRDRFLHEAVVTSQLQHPGIVPVHELGKGDSGDAYYVMKLLDGQPFRQLIRDTHLSLQQSLDAAGRSKRRSVQTHQLCDAVLPLLERFIDVCNAVAYAHQQGVLHRDLKPANVMIGRFGETIVVDWGLAKRIDEPSPSRDETAIEASIDDAEKWVDDANDDGDSPRTSAGSVIGTPVYMSPEQAFGQIDALTPASDIYSLGVVLYEILVGHHPFKGCDVETALQRVRRGEWASAKQVRREIPRALSAICDAAMAFDARDRYDSAEALADDVRRFVAGEAVLADRENWLDRTARWCRRHRTVAISLAGTTLVLLLASAVFGYFIHQAHQSERAARIATEAAHQESLQLLGESRSAADAWLIDLSGSLQFYPGLSPIRDQLIDQAIDHYSGLVQRDRLGHMTRQGEPVPNRLTSHRAIELCKLHLRLGDLYRLQQQTESASRHYQLAEQQLTELQSHSVIPVLLQAEVDLQRANVWIGRLLVNDIELQEDEFAKHERNARQYLATIGIAGPEIAASEPKSTQVYQLASCIARLNLAVGRTAVEKQHDTVVRHHHEATRWANWLAQSRGSAADQRLLQTTTIAWANSLQTANRDKEATTAWSNLVGFLEDQTKSFPNRIDYQQSLAHARMQLAQQLAGAHAEDKAMSEYRSAIEELKHAWSLSDVDGFYRLNLSAAESNLGILLSGGTDAQRGEAVQSLTDSLQILRQMMSHEPTIDGIRRFCETSHALANAQLATPGADAVPALRDADVGYQVLAEHARLTPKDKETWMTVMGKLEKILRKNGDDEDDEAVQTIRLRMREATLPNKDSD